MFNDVHQILSGKFWPESANEKYDVRFLLSEEGFGWKSPNFKQLFTNYMCLLCFTRVSNSFLWAYFFIISAHSKNKKKDIALLMYHCVCNVSHLQCIPIMMHLVCSCCGKRLWPRIFSDCVILVSLCESSKRIKSSLCL